MDRTVMIREAFERRVQVLERYPSVGQGTAVTRVRVEDGVACTVEDGPWRLRVDQSERSGGTGSGPDPGVLIRGALGSCLAVGYVRWAARLGVPLAGLSVEVHAGYDARGQYGVAGVAPGYTAVRCVVTVETDAPEEDVRRLLDVADAHSPYLDVFQRSVTVDREMHVVTPSPHQTDA